MTIDLDLPVNHGISILRFLRKRTQALPVLVLAGCASVAERIRVLDSGADDLVQKPFAFSELSARMRAVMPRNPFRPHDERSSGRNRDQRVAYHRSIRAP
jgi:DNA-binding response OmpR family regulator